jgi:hypothetical protein
MKMIGLILALLVAMASAVIAGEADLATNAPATAASIFSAAANRNIPLISFSKVSLLTGIENLTRQAEINYITVPDLYPSTGNNGEQIEEPAVTIEWTNVTVGEALQRLLNQYQLHLTADPATSVWRLTRDLHPVDPGPARAFGLSPTRSPGDTNGVIPLIQLSDVPLNIALTHLVRQANQLSSSTNPVVVLDPRLQAAPTDNADQNEEEEQPVLNLRWRNLTAAQALVALCENYHLDAIKDRDTGIIRIKPHPAAHRLWHQRRQ